MFFSKGKEKTLTGCTRRPDKGPANQTNAVSSFDKSSDNKYGVP